MEPSSKEFRRDVLKACDAGGGTQAVGLQFGVSEVVGAEDQTATS